MRGAGSWDEWAGWDESKSMSGFRSAARRGIVMATRQFLRACCDPGPDSQTPGCAESAAHRLQGETTGLAWAPGSRQRFQKKRDHPSPLQRVEKACLVEDRLRGRQNSNPRRRFIRRSLTSSPPGTLSASLGYGRSTVIQEFLLPVPSGQRPRWLAFGPNPS